MYLTEREKDKIDFDFCPRTKVFWAPVFFKKYEI